MSKKIVLFVMLIISGNVFSQIGIYGADVRLGVTYQPIFAINRDKIKEFDDNTVFYQYDYITGKIENQYSYATGVSLTFANEGGSQITADLLYGKREQTLHQFVSEYEESAFTSADTLFSIGIKQSEVELHTSANVYLFETNRTYHYFYGGVVFYSPLRKTTTWTARPHVGQEIEQYHVFEKRDLSFQVGIGLGFSTDIVLTDNLWLTIRPQYNYLATLSTNYNLTPHQLRLHVGLSMLL